MRDGLDDQRGNRLLGWHVTGAVAGKSTHRGVGCGDGKDAYTQSVLPWDPRAQGSEARERRATRVLWSGGAERRARGGGGHGVGSGR